MFKVGDKIMVHGYEEWGEGEIKEENHNIYGDLYVTYFSDKDVSLTSCSQNNFYQTLEQQIIPYLSELSIVYDPIKPIIFASSEIIDRINKYIDKEDKNTMLNITNYNYNEDTAITIIEWSDGTKTTVHAEHPDTADPYTGFVTACAKKAFGNNNTINNLFDEWAIKKPVREQKAQIKANEKLLEEKRIAEKRKVKKEKWAIRKRAAGINREYKAKKLAHEKYGVPIDYKAGDNN